MMRANTSLMSRWWTRRASQAVADADDTRRPGEEEQARIYERLRLPRTLNYPATSLGQMFDQTAARYPHAPAMAFGDSHWTYGQLLDHVNRLAGGMAHQGLRRGDRVLMSMPNCPDFVLCFLAMQKLGAVMVNAGPLMGRDDLRELVQMTTPRMIVALDLQATGLWEAVGQGADVMWLWSSLQTYQPLWKRMGYRMKRWQAWQQLEASAPQATVEQWLADGPARPPTVAPATEAVAVLQPTGGTTGTLKVAQLTHRNLLCNATQLSAWASLRPGQERVVAALPMFHVYGLMLTVVVPVLNAAQVLPMPRFEIEPFMDLLREHRPTMVPIVPAIAELLCRELTTKPDETVLDVLSRAFVLSGAAPLLARTSRRFEQVTGRPIVQGYGLTEASPVTHANPLQAPRVGSIGLPLADTQMRLADLDDPERDAAPGQPGELAVRGPQVMVGYAGNPAETAHVLRPDLNGDTWLFTGDIARVDEAGYVYLVDRCKHMINHAGLKVWPTRIEHLLASHADVNDAAVIGRPVPLHGEAVSAIVVARPGVDTSALADALRALCREHLAPYEVPTRFQFVQQLPPSRAGQRLQHCLDGGITPDHDGELDESAEQVADDHAPLRHRPGREHQP